MKDCAVLKTVSVPVPEKSVGREHYPRINLQNVLGDDFQRGPCMWCLQLESMLYTNTSMSGAGRYLNQENSQASNCSHK